MEREVRRAVNMVGITSVLVFMSFGIFVSYCIEFRLIVMPSLLGMNIDLLMIW